MRLQTSSSLLSLMALSFGVAAGLGCAGVKPNATTTGAGGSGASNTGNGGSGGSISTGNGGTGPIPITPISGNFSCTDFSACPSGSGSFNTGSESTFDNGGSGSTTIAYPLDKSLFPSNLGPIQVQMTTPGTSARIAFHTTSGNVDVKFFGSCESAPGTGCSVTLPLDFTRMMIPASQNEDIQLTARVLSGSTVTGDSAPITAAWTQVGLTGGLYFWTVVPNPPQKSAGDTGDIPTPPNYILLDPPPSGSSPPYYGTQIQRYDFSQTNPIPQVVWTDDGGPGSTPPYDGAPQAWNGGQGKGHCIGCHTITNDGRFMALTIGGSSTTDGANWTLLDIQNQKLELINPPGSGLPDTNGNASASPISDPQDYWKSYRNEGYATETSWGPGGDVMVSMYSSKLYFNTVTVNGASATVTRQGLAFPTSAAKIDLYQSDPFWSHDGSKFVYTSFNQSSPNGGLNGDLKLNGQIVMASATPGAVNDDAAVLVGREPNISKYYPCTSEDTKYVVYNESTCGSGDDPAPLGGGYGKGSCDGYDDQSALLWWISSSGGSGVRLDNANGIANGNVTSYSNSWPRFSPDVGTFRGQTLYWIAFSSRRPYGVQLNTNGITQSQPQLWFTGVTVGQEIAIGDPSHAPVWLPGQNPMGNGSAYGNHVPQWVKVAIVIDGSL
jgi:hypothetical protein